MFPARTDWSGIILSGDAHHLDKDRTMAVFGHPDGGLFVPVGGANGGRKLRLIPGFRPIGSEVGIFQYKASTYFDTFYANNVGGDFEDHRKFDQNLQDTLGVFLRKAGRTREICEYYVNDLEKNN